MMDTRPMKQQQIIMDEGGILNLNSVMSLEDSRDDSRLQTMEKIKMIEELLNQNK